MVDQIYTKFKIYKGQPSTLLMQILVCTYVTQILCEGNASFATAVKKSRANFALFVPSKNYGRVAKYPSQCFKFNR